MATQFEILSNKIDEILNGINAIWGALRDLEEEVSQRELDLSSEVPSEGDDPVSQVINAPRGRRRGMNRREVEVKAAEGGTTFRRWEELDPRVVKAIEIAVTDHFPYELYEDLSGQVRISVDAEVLHRLNKSETYQPPVPMVRDDEIDALGTGERDG